MSELAEFLLARITDDERDAREYQDDDSPGTWRRWGEDVCTAHRAIVELHYGSTDRNCGFACRNTICPTLRRLAMTYADHDEYRDEWRIR